jgi:hypothetical protein
LNGKIEKKAGKTMTLTSKLKTPRISRNEA